MVSSITDSHSSNILAGLPTQQATPSGSTDSFTEQLTSALEGYLAPSGNAANLEIDTQKTQSQDSGVRQFPVTVKNPDSPAVQSAAATTPDTTTDGLTGTFLGFVSVTASAASSVPVATPAPATTTPVVAATNASANTSGDATAAGTTPAATTTMTEVDAYWAAQPPPVQQLRNIPDLAGRSAMAQQLADQGYTIDKAIMVWGWDPMKTMQTRQMYGYTWAPSWNQGNVPVPGITIGGEAAYDPNHAPAGSIAVNTDFAKGPGVTNPWS